MYEAIALHIQWNPSNLDTIESVLIREVSLLKVYKNGVYLGRKEVSCLERCPYFKYTNMVYTWGGRKYLVQRGVLISGVSLQRGSTVYTVFIDVHPVH